MKSQNVGFTLIELVVVIVLIGILAGVALPRIFQSMNSAKKANVQAVVTTMSSSLAALQADYLLIGSSALPASFASAGIAMTNTGLPLVSSGVSADKCSVILTQLAGVPSNNMANISGRVNYLNFSTTSSAGLYIKLVPRDLWTTTVGDATYGIYAGVTQTFGSQMGLSGKPIGCFYFYNKLFPTSALVIYYSDVASPSVGYADLIGGPANWTSGGSSDGF